MTKGSRESAGYSPTLGVDNAVERLHELSRTYRQRVGFLYDFQHSNDPTIVALFGPRTTDRLAQLQYDDKQQPRFIDIPRSGGGRRQVVQVQINTWSSEIRKDTGRKGKLNEDATMIAPFGDDRLVAAVFDGASSQKDIKALGALGLTGSWYVSHLTALQFPSSEQYARLKADPDTTAEAFMIALNRWLRQRLEEVDGVNYDDRLSIPGMAATIAVVDYKAGKITIAHAADTLGIAEYDDHYEVLTDDKNACWDEETRAEIDRIVEDSWREGDPLSPIEAKRDPRIRAQLARSFGLKINTPTGTGIVNGQEELVTNGLIYTSEVTIPANSGLKLHLVTDGIHALWTSREDLKNDKDMQIRKILGALNTRTNNPITPIVKVVDQLDMDPGGYLFRRAMDDATRVSIVIMPGDENSPFKEENERLQKRDHDEIERFRAANRERRREIYYTNK